MQSKSSLENRVALITGASRGIGKCLAEDLAREGMRLVLTASTKSSLQSVCDSITADGGVADLANMEEVYELTTKTPEIYGGLDVLINNAGVAVNQPILETTHEDWERCFRINATAPFILCRELVPVLAQSDRATIINIGSVVGIKGYPNQAAYGASKHALLGFTKVLAREVQPLGIRVHILNPGGVATDMVREMRPDLDTRGLIRPKEISDLVVYLLKNRGNAVLDDLHIRRASGEPWY